MAWAKTVNARVGPACFPVVQVGLSFLKALEAQPFQRCILGMTDASFHLALAIRIADTAGQRDDIVVLEHVAVQRIDGGIVDVWLEHPLAQIVEDDDPCHPAQPAKGLLVQLGPRLRTGAEHQQANRFAAIAKSQHE
jgi:hypothetical protein